MLNTVIGFDVSTKNVAYCIFGKDVVDYGFLEQWDNLSILVHNHNVTAIYIERIPYCKNQQTAIKLSEAVGRLQRRVIEIDDGYHMIEVARWKMLAGCRGNASKDDVKRLMVATTSLPNRLEQDIYDACGIAIAGVALEHEKQMVENRKVR